MGASYHEYLASYAGVLAITLAGCLLVGGIFGVNRLLRPSAPSRQKATTYECGVDPAVVDSTSAAGQPWAQVNIRFYVFAYLYVVFAVDAVFLFPWATVFAALGSASVAEMAVFIGIVAVGLGYAWGTGVLRWT